MYISVLSSLQIEMLLLQIWEVVYGKDNQVKEVPKVMQLKGHKVSLGSTGFRAFEDVSQSRIELTTFI
jgi:hypothetical protein